MLVLVFTIRALVGIHSDVCMLLPLLALVAFFSKPLAL